MFVARVNDFNGPAGPRTSSRAGVAARTLQDRLTGSLVALAFTSAMLVGLALSSNDIQVSAHAVQDRLWHAVSTFVCGSHLDAISLVGPSCGRAAP